MKLMVRVTLRSRKGTEWTLDTPESKLAIVKANAKKWGYTVVKVDR